MVFKDFKPIDVFIGLETFSDFLDPLPDHGDESTQNRYRLTKIPQIVASDRAPPRVIAKLERAFSRLSGAYADSLA